MVFFVLQLLLERKSTEVGKLIEETEKNMKDLAENINQAQVNSLKPQKSPSFSSFARCP